MYRLEALLVHPGTQHSFRLASQLHAHGCLRRFWTGLAYVPDRLLDRFLRVLPRNFYARTANRRLTGVPHDKLKTSPSLELRALCRLRMGLDGQEVLFNRNASFQRGVPQEELVGSDIVIGFDTSSHLLVERAAGLGRCFVLDRSTAHPSSYQRLFPLLVRQFPEWGFDLAPHHPQLAAAVDFEHLRANRIVVASSYSLRTLLENGVPEEKIAIIPYGVDLEKFLPSPSHQPSRPLRFLFLGSIGIRKGVPLLLEAWRSLDVGDSELWLAGPISSRHKRLIPRLRGLRLLGKVPNPSLPGLFRHCDVLVFPSFSEGFGLVLLEAMASGLPVISTDATAAPDIITNGVEGYVVPAGDLEALRIALRRFIDSPGDARAMSAAARRRAERYTWDAYGDRWYRLLHQVV